MPSVSPHDSINLYSYLFLHSPGSSYPLRARRSVIHGFLDLEMQKTVSCFYSGSCLHLFPSCNTTTSGTCHGAYHWNGTHVGLMVTDNPFLSSSSFSPDDYEVGFTDLHFSGIGEIMFSGPRGSPYLCQLSINDSMNRSFKELQDEPRKSGCKCHLSGEMPLRSDEVNHQHEWSLAVSGDKTCSVHVKGDEVSFGTKNLLDCLFPEMCLACSEYFPSHHDVNFKFHDFGDAARTSQLPIFSIFWASWSPIFPSLPILAVLLCLLITPKVRLMLCAVKFMRILVPDVPSAVKGLSHALNGRCGGVRIPIFLFWLLIFISLTPVLSPDPELVLPKFDGSSTTYHTFIAAFTAYLAVKAYSQIEFFALKATTHSWNYTKRH